jgi:hypothetical protein
MYAIAPVALETHCAFSLELHTNEALEKLEMHTETLGLALKDL